MHFDHSQEWLRLTGEYRAKGDEELLELQREFADLTDVAQQVLAAELRSRGLNQKIADENNAAAKPRKFAAAANGPWTKREISPFVDRAQAAAPGGLLGSIVGGSSIDPIPDEQQGDPELDENVEFSWKTVLCECEEHEQAIQISEVLRRAGIESWIQSRERGFNYTRILVAADELDRAQTVIASPIPQDIIDESRETVPEFEPPRCPGCGAEDPILESAEPVNAWKCEICDREWTDPAGESQSAGPFT
jgi:hypothetical protein